MGTILLSLAELDEWEQLFRSSKEFADYRDDLRSQTERLRFVVTEALEAERSRLKPGDRNRVWLEISAADLLFLTEEQQNCVVVQAYRDAVPQDDFFAWDAARRQLQLFQRLGIRAELAEEVIGTLDKRIEHPKPDDGFHLILFAGHQVDLPGRTSSRFPAESEAAARKLIQQALGEVCGHGLAVEVWASAAPGGDILVHEICRDLKVESRVYLPMPKEIYARLTFGNGLDSWRTRFLELVWKREPVVFNDREGLPKWLVGSGFDPWERGNRWMLEMARTAGAARITLLALWDGKEQGEGAPGGTAHMVRIAQAAGDVDIVPIDTKPLVARVGPRAGGKTVRGCKKIGT
jgi:hypothetical protein